MKYRWSLAPAQPALTDFLHRELRLSPLLAQCLLNRGLSEPDAIRHFLQPRLKQLADPFLLPNMEAAVHRLMEARNRRERVVLFGDYDVDGVTATALLRLVLSALGWETDCYLPHRLDEGYGLSRDGAENCLNRFPTTLLLAVDCGSTATETIDWLRQRGVDVIVLDHHQVSSPAPAAVALVNPQLPGTGPARFQELCSAGLAFKLAHALVKRTRESADPAALAFDLKPLLDLVALGTIADLVPLTGENRILASTGLARLNSTARPGLIALREVAQIRVPIGSFEVGYLLGPRLNAAGRLENAQQSLDLLLSTDLEQAVTMAAALDAQNRERQAIERGITEEVIGAIRARFNPETDCFIVEGQLLWHVGVVGIVASRVLQEFHRPTIILGGDAHHWRGSGRSVEGFDLAAALRACDDILVRHGGHAMAAGLTIEPAKVDALRERLNRLARQSLTREQLQPALRIDAEVPLSSLTLEVLGELDRLQPTGQGNPVVHVAVRNLVNHRAPQRMGKDGQHVKLRVTDGRIVTEAVWWRGGDADWPTGRFDLAVVPQVNDYNGERSVQLRILDWQPAQRQAG